MSEQQPVFSPMRDFRVAMLFMTRLPVGRIGGLAADDLARASWAFPLVGIVVGGLAGAVVYAGASALLHPLACALAALAVQALLTGALHEDGLADVADGLGGTSKARRLEIMRDSRIGSFGVLALVFSVGLRAALLAGMAGAGSAWLALIAAGAMSRGVLPAVMMALPPARADGMSQRAGRPDGRTVSVAGLIGVGVLAFCLPGPAVVAAIVFCVILAGILIWWATRRLGGQTGDVLGALQQLTEIAVLLAAAGWGLDFA